MSLVTSHLLVSRWCWVWFLRPLLCLCVWKDEVRSGLSFCLFCPIFPRKCSAIPPGNLPPPPGRASAQQSAFCAWVRRRSCLSATTGVWLKLGDENPLCLEMALVTGGVCSVHVTEKHRLLPTPYFQPLQTFPEVATHITNGCFFFSVSSFTACLKCSGLNLSHGLAGAGDVCLSLQWWGLRMASDVPEFQSYGRVEQIK